MTQPTRMLLVLVFIASGTLLVLLLMAQRYGSLFSDRLEAERGRASATVPAAETLLVDAATTEALLQVDAFIQVRRQLKPLVDAADLDAGWVERLQYVRERALATSILDQRAYRAVRALYRSWRAGLAQQPASYDRAFELRRGQLKSLDLGSRESLDL